MKWRRVALVLITAGIVLSAMPLSAHHSATGDTSEEKIVQAYMEAPGVARAMESYLEDGYVDRGARSMYVWGSCGFAGCSHEYLVVHLFSSGGTNPQDRSILARVYGTSFGKPIVELVEITPNQEGREPRLGGKDKHPAPHPQLQGVEKHPPPPPKGSTELSEEDP